MAINPIIGARFDEHLETYNQMRQHFDAIQEAASICKEALDNGHKVLFCGNGGSAADSQHLAAELVGRFVKERRSLPSIALTTDTSILTAVGNDYGYDEVFARQVQGLGQAGDVLVGISTSGNSKNVVKAVEEAKAMGLKTIAFTGQGGGRLGELCDATVAVPSKVTARIQEMHILVGHIICELVEEDYD
ncbi:MAG: D-sedoheptulose 7-phosphate isomerase [Veillonella sp.]|nr:D-sedoheptulose 7-phosphate isomerase [Veillonella sp.]